MKLDKERGDSVNMAAWVENVFEWREKQREKEKMRELGLLPTIR